MKASIFAIPILVGALLTLATGLLNTTPPHLLGATWYGWPLAWLYVIVYPGSPWSVNWLNFAADLTFWFILALVVTVLLLKRPRSLAIVQK
jgi:hypothetical protein